MSKQKIVVVGNGMVGYKFCEKLIEKDNNQNFQIITFCEEPRPAYDRVHLSAYFDGKTAEDLTMAPLEWYKENNIEFYLNEKVTEIQRDNKKVITNKGTEVEYDKLIMATGSDAFMPPIPGHEKEGVFVYRTIEDLEDIIAYSKKSKSAAVIGGGLLGLEAAKAMVDLDLNTHVIEFAPKLMPRQIDEIGSMTLQQKIEELGVKIHLSKATKNIAGEGKVAKMEFEDGSDLDVDMIVVSAGIKPRDELARAAGLEVGPRGGIVVNNQLKTNDPDIYAVGECALHGGMIYGLVAPGYRMADAIVADLCGEAAEFAGMDMSTKLKLMGVDVSSIGDPLTSGENTENVTLINETGGVYKKLVLEKETRKLLGAILIGDNSDYNKLYQFYLKGEPMPEAPETTIVQGAAEEEGEMSNDTQICSCENVTKGDLIEALESGECNSVGDLKKCTKAGTGCGSCVGLMTDIYNKHLESSGGVVDKSLCEHFKYTRQELVQIIKATKITSYEELLEKYGTGHGCEICKPTVASILASYVNDHILDDGLNQLQDSNDRYLANIQKNGSYSVVPRVPGGEITPDQLICLGEVAKKYNLYSKITGGQRVDLFGARLEDLPSIWEDLIKVGFESGHAYGKSLRTVKSCVGSTWCRYGVQDSVGFAIRLENRYKGIRSPHKIKFAVSGCARECAEAQCKDFGIIATDKGWNLYVAGNGGAVPQHAALFCADEETETVVKYIDRVMMYYIRTADRLQRTATWFNKLPGGLQHLQDVVINDSLGIAEELDAEMQHLIDTYQCEWTTVVNDPEKRKLFRAFVNTDEQDDSIEFVDERGQVKPLLKEVTPA